MSFFSYAELPLEIIQTLNYVKRPIYTDDGVTYLYTFYDITVACVFNPQATSFDFTFDPTGKGPVPSALAGRFPARTDAAIKHILMQPRQKLIYRDDDGGRDIVVSPLGDDECDAKNGPFPQECHVRAIHGTKTWLVSFRITSYVNECSRKLDNGDQNPLLSHRWTKRHAYHDDFLSTITTTGDCIFRTDVLQNLDTYPDSYRADLVPVLLNNFKRQVEVTVNSDGASLSYVCTDTEKHFNTPAASRIEVSHTSWFSHLGLGQAALNVALGESFTELVNPLNIPGRAIKIAKLTIPKFYNTCVCKVWGDRNTARALLRQICLRTLLNRLGPADTFNSEELLMSEDVAGKYAEATATFRTGPEQALALIIAGNNPAGIPNGWALTNNKFGSEVVTSTAADVGDPVAPNRIILSNAASVKNKIIGPNGAWGDWLGTLIAQTLSTPCAIPEQPPDGNVERIDNKLYPPSDEEFFDE